MLYLSHDNMYRFITLRLWLNHTSLQKDSSPSYPRLIAQPSFSLSSQRHVTVTLWMYARHIYYSIDWNMTFRNNISILGNNKWILWFQEVYARLLRNHISSDRKLHLMTGLNRLHDLVYHSAFDYDNGKCNVMIIYTWGQCHGTKELSLSKPE